jgi:glycosyltransferase involved in cell wall biosynthesis
VTAADAAPSPSSKGRLVHLTTTDMSLDWLLGPQLEAFLHAGWEVIGVSAPGDHVTALEASGIEHVALRHATRAMSPARDARAMGELWAVLRRMRPTVLHTHNPKPGIYGRLAGRLAGVPVVVNTQHGLYAQPGDPWRRRAAVYGLERLAAMCSDAELVQSGDDLETLASLFIPRWRLHRLGNGIDLGRFDPASVAEGERARVRAELGVADDEVLVGAVGRLVAEKGLVELFDAARRLQATHSRVRIVVVGPADLDKGDAIGAEAVEAARADGVILPGRRDDMVAVYSALDAYVLASHREGFPRSAMEAAAMSLPVVATDIRGCREVVDHGVTGELVPVRDAGALARAIGHLADDESLRRSMGEAGRVRALAEFDVRQVIELTLDIYEDLLGRAPRSLTASRPS